MGNQEIQTKVDCLFHLHSHDNYRKKHHDEFVKKCEELRQRLILQPDLEVERLAHELAEHFHEISIDSQVTVNAVTKELIASNKEIIPIPPIVDLTAANAEKRYSAWAWKPRWNLKGKSKSSSSQLSIFLQR